MKLLSVKRKISFKANLLLLSFNNKNKKINHFHRWCELSAFCMISIGPLVAVRQDNVKISQISLPDIFKYANDVNTCKNSATPHSFLHFQKLQIEKKKKLQFLCAVKVIKLNVNQSRIRLATKRNDSKKSLAITLILAYNQLPCCNPCTS